MPSSSRIHTLDITRGVAVLGILLLNIFAMGVSYYDYVPFNQPSWSDKLGQVLYYFVLRDRFITLFAMLFGAGLYLQWRSFDGQTALLKRRLYWLLLFGLLHRIFVWPGDILFNYAICGLILLRYLSLSPQQQLSMALRFIAMGILLTIASSLLLYDFTPVSRESAEYLDSFAAWTGSYQGQLQMQWTLALADALIFPLTYMWLLLGLMLLGCYGFRQHWFTEGLAQQRAWLLPLSLLLSGIAYPIGLQHNAHLQALSEALLSLAAMPMSLWLIHCIAHSQAQGQLAQRLQAVGKIPLSLYLLQSLLGTWLLRDLAPQLNLSLNWFGYIGIALCGCLLQLWLAPLWLRYFAQGPLEWLWRRLAFGASYQPHR
ncbi:DUF418 domain-containing protein [Shewanella sp.]|uniref:DUF418 domain-containing protein n=1 Tax=Shewanella sp. TaxID=50422 RepID=UPI003A97EADE